MEKENFVNSARSISGLKSLIQDSKKIREARGEDFFGNKKSETVEASKINSQLTTKIQASSEQISTENSFKNIRESHLKLSSMISDNDKKFFEQNDQVLVTKKPRSKTVHLYIDEKIEHFLKTESEKSETKWGLRKNAGIGQLIQKFIGNFIELKKREERQLKRVKKVIDEFQAHLVEFKKYSVNATEYQATEIANQKMKVLSNDLNILLALLEFEVGALKNLLSDDQFRWVEFIIKWKFHS